MSKYANPDNAYAWIDGDAFRGLPNAAMPADPFAETIANFDAYGGIEAGFDVSTEQSVTKKKVFNYRKAAYKVLRDALDEGVKFRAVDNTKASALTRAQGGVVKNVGELFTMEKGEGEEFSFLLTLNDGIDKMALWYPLVTLAGPATRAAIDGQSIDGWEFNLTALKPPIEILPKLPEGMTPPAS